MKQEKEQKNENRRAMSMRASEEAKKLSVWIDKLKSENASLKKQLKDIRNNVIDEAIHVVQSYSNAVTASELEKQLLKRKIQEGKQP